MNENLNIVLIMDQLDSGAGRSNSDSEYQEMTYCPSCSILRPKKKMKQVKVIGVMFVNKCDICREKIKERLNK